MRGGGDQDDRRWVVVVKFLSIVTIVNIIDPQRLHRNPAATVIVWLCSMYRQRENIKMITRAVQDSSVSSLPVGSQCIAIPCTWSLLALASAPC